MARSGQRPYCSRVHFTSRKRHRRIAVDKRYSAAFIRLQRWAHWRENHARGWAGGQVWFPRLERPGEGRRRWHHAAGNRGGSLHRRQPRSGGRAFRRGRWRHLYGQLLALLAWFGGVIVEGEVEESRPWWMPLHITKKNLVRELFILSKFLKYPYQEIGRKYVYISIYIIHKSYV